jgi:hypothetical protein
VQKTKQFEGRKEVFARVATTTSQFHCDRWRFILEGLASTESYAVHAREYLVTSKVLRHR